MIVVNSKEFRTNQKKYFDMAINEQVFVKRGKNTFVVTSADNRKVVTDNLMEPDDDLARAITMDEFVEGAKEYIRKLYRQGKNENNISSGGAGLL